MAEISMQHQFLCSRVVVYKFSSSNLLYFNGYFINASILVMLQQVAHPKNGKIAYKGYPCHPLVPFYIVPTS